MLFLNSLLEISEGLFILLAKIY